MKAKHILPAIAFCSVFFFPQLALAHEAAARHGGVVRTASDLQFELVQKGPDVVIYVEDHGKAVSTAGMSGNLIVQSGAEKSETPLLPAGEGQLAAKGVKAGSGAKAIAVINTPKGKPITVRFVLK